MTPAYANHLATVYQDDALATLRQMPSESVHCCITSPPYWGLRDYGCAGQLGLEPTPAEYVANMVAVFAGVRRVLRDDGTLWLNCGDSYSSKPAFAKGNTGFESYRGSETVTLNKDYQGRNSFRGDGIKTKDLVGIPWMLAFALRADGWYLRQDIIWHKPAPMPESVTDRCTKAHEYLFLLSKSARYYYDQQAILEPLSDVSIKQIRNFEQNGIRDGMRAKAVVPGQRLHTGGPSGIGGGSRGAAMSINGSNRRSVWTVNTQPFSGAHFAVFPSKLIEPCILAGTSEEGCCGACGSPRVRQTSRTKVKRNRPNDLTKRTGEDGTGNHCPNGVAGVAVETTGWAASCQCDVPTQPCTILDPFLGSGTTAAVAIKWGRKAIGIELNAEYVRLAEKRIDEAVADLGLFAGEPS